MSLLEVNLFKRNRSEIPQKTGSSNLYNRRNLFVLMVVIAPMTGDIAPCQRLDIDSDFL